MNAKKKKIATAATAVALSAALLLGGTFAWQSANQTALNVAEEEVNPGGRLHDDFDGTNKDVYVENFSDAETGQDIYVRIRLDEYLEVVNGDDKYIYGGEDAQREDVTTWTTYAPVDGLVDLGSVFRQNVDWDFDGETDYMPTFNMNKDSLVADVNGTIEGPDGSHGVTDGDKEDKYGDYTDWTAGDTKNAYEVTDNDTNDADELADQVAGVIETGAIPAEVGDAVAVTDDTVEHIAGTTPTATVMTMQEWIDADRPTGDIWVYDTDGWAYYAKALAPGETTGLLLDGIAVNTDDSYYYAINVVAQFVTKNDLGAVDGTGFYDTTKGVAPSDNALTLLENIGVNVSGAADDGDTGGDEESLFRIESVTGSDTLEPGGSLAFRVYDHQGNQVTDMAGLEALNLLVSFTSPNAGSDEELGYELMDDGTLVISATEMYGNEAFGLIVEMTDPDTSDTYSYFVRVTVEDGGEVDPVVVYVSDGYGQYDGVVNGGTVQVAAMDYTLRLANADLGSASNVTWSVNPEVEGFVVNADDSTVATMPLSAYNDNGLDYTWTVTAAVEGGETYTVTLTKPQDLNNRIDMPEDAYVSGPTVVLAGNGIEEQYYLAEADDWYGAAFYKVEKADGGDLAEGTAMDMNTGKLTVGAGESGQLIVTAYDANYASYETNRRTMTVEVLTEAPTFTITRPDGVSFANTDEDIVLYLDDKNELTFDHGYAVDMYSEQGGMMSNDNEDQTVSYYFYADTLNNYTAGEYTFGFALMDNYSIKSTATATVKDPVYDIVITGQDEDTQWPGYAAPNTSWNVAVTRNGVALDADAIGWNVLGGSGMNTTVYNGVMTVFSENDACVITLEAIVGSEIVATETVLVASYGISSSFTVDSEGVVNEPMAWSFSATAKGTGQDVDVTEYFGDDFVWSFTKDGEETDAVTVDGYTLIVSEAGEYGYEVYPAGMPEGFNGGGFTVTSAE